MSMAGKRPLVDKVIRRSLEAYRCDHGTKPFTGDALHSYMFANDLVHSSISNLNSQMVCSRLAYWAKTGQLEDIFLISETPNLFRWREE